MRTLIEAFETPEFVVLFICAIVATGAECWLRAPFQAGAAGWLLQLGPPRLEIRHRLLTARRVASILRVLWDAGGNRPEQASPCLLPIVANLEGLFINRPHTKYYDTNLTPAVAPRLHTNSQFFAGTRSKENASRNSFGSGIWSRTESVAPFIETLTTMQWREPASVRTQAS
jgi:hypothetical protein